MGPIIGRREGLKRDVHALFLSRPDEWIDTRSTAARVRCKEKSAVSALLQLLEEGRLQKQVSYKPRRVRYKLAQQGETT